MYTCSLLSSCACWVCIEHQIDVITLSPSHLKCNAIIGNDIVIFCVDLCVAFCICLCLFLHCIKTLLSLINKLFLPDHLMPHKLFEEQYLCIFTERHTLSHFIFRLINAS